MWDSPRTFTSMHRPGIAKVIGNKIILDGTTIEEVKKYHQETLTVVVKEANQLERKILKEKEDKKQQEKEKQDRLRNQLNALADTIVFEQ